MRSSVKCVALLCLLLTFWSAFAFAAHHHSKSTESAKCTVCVAAHSAAPNRLRKNSVVPRSGSCTDIHSTTFVCRY